jgi:tRNA pseudouridine(38-40) synthase
MITIVRLPVSALLQSRYNSNIYLRTYKHIYIKSVVLSKHCITSRYIHSATTYSYDDINTINNDTDHTQQQHQQSSIIPSRYVAVISYNGTLFNGFQSNIKTPSHMHTASHNNTNTTTGTGSISIQSFLEKCISQITNNPSIQVICSGRTDSGVHAVKQYIQFDVIRYSPRKQQYHNDILTCYQLRKALNHFMAIESDEKLRSGNENHIKKSRYPQTYVYCHTLYRIHQDSTFHVRRSCQKRIYLYRIICSHILSLHQQHNAWYIDKSLEKHLKQSTLHTTGIDITLLHHAASQFIGTWNMNIFRSSRCQSKRSVRTINSIHVDIKDLITDSSDVYYRYQTDSGLKTSDDKEKNNVIQMNDNKAIEIEITAPSFGYQQVRRMIGSMIQIAIHNKHPSYIGAMLQRGADVPLDSKEHQILTQQMLIVPPYGLYLMDCIYHDDDDDDGMRMSMKKKMNAVDVDSDIAEECTL